MSDSPPHLRLIEERDSLGVSFLICGEKRADACKVFDGLREKLSTQFLTRVTSYLDGIRNDRHYHGWTKSQYGGRYTDAYVFKFGDDQRFYGYKYHPPQEPRFVGCVLAHHDTKNQAETEERCLRIAIDLKATYDHLRWPHAA